MTFLIFLRDFWLRRTRILISYRNFQRLLKSHRGVNRIQIAFCWDFSRMLKTYFGVCEIFVRWRCFCALWIFCFISSLSWSGEQLWQFFKSQSVKSEWKTLRHNFQNFNFQKSPFMRAKSKLCWSGVLNCLINTPKSMDPTKFAFWPHKRFFWKLKFWFSKCCSKKSMLLFFSKKISSPP